ncbi:NAD-dependent epimerase/dehydratase family protein [Deinococcus detaillensis]|uniref:NAD-dependent epimerase/dehydratase family protein n=1 Tax=Deinococcus detaillensis TaxID=2592048 RepID=A0A553UK19_9DEIO|nr:NAD-dependent epimerase/dehydratase family protein [Deinococcus detaillensis]TSA80537.1 NAD-dependent epimerase/dehydratase family protein [Deinococcus detaillensis]
MTRVLITGALGQVGTELTLALRERYGVSEVLATDIRRPSPGHPAANGPFQLLDGLDAAGLLATVQAQGIQEIYHLAALLSAVAEAKPALAWHLNMQSLINVLDAAHTCGCRVFAPSSIAVFGPDTPRDLAPQLTSLRPTSMYGVTKVAGELLCDDYARRYGVDVRGLRYPGLISASAPPGGGTTDYSVEMYHAAASSQPYACFLNPDTALEMLFMPDAVRATLELMDAPKAALRYPNAYNLAGMSLTPAAIAAAIRRQLHAFDLPHFEVSYAPDPVRQAIANGWPRSIDDAAARQDWSWQPAYDLQRMTSQMLAALTHHTTGGLAHGA